MHEDGCVFRNEYGSELDDGGFEDDDDGEVQEEEDHEGDRAVEELRRRLERLGEQGGRRKIKPNISGGWIAKLRELLKKARASPAPP